LLHHGVPAVSGGLLGADNRRRLEAGEGLSPAGREAVAAALRILDALDAELDPLRRQITAFAARQPGCRALQAAYGIGPITAAALWSELGDSARFSASRKAGGTPAWTSPCTPPTANAPPGHLFPAGLAAAALGTVRSRAVRRPARLARPRLLPAGRRPDRRRTSHPLDGPQAGPPRPPHPARPGR
jgi:hypothetical protein